MSLIDDAQRERLLRVALGHAAAVGIDAVSMAHVADDADLELATLSTAYTDETSLLDGAVDWATGQLRDDLEVIASRYDDPVQAVLTMMQRAIDGPPHEQTALYLVARELVTGSAISPHLMGILEELQDRLVATLSEAQFRGRLGGVPPRFAVVVLAAGVILPQLMGAARAEGPLRGVHAILTGDAAADVDPATRRDELAGADPARAWASGTNPLFAASLDIVWNGLLARPDARHAPNLGSGRSGGNGRDG